MQPTLTYELSNLEDTFASLPECHSLETYAWTLLDNELIRIKKSIIRGSLLGHKSASLKAYVQAHQRGIIALMDQALAMSTEPNLHLISKLEELLRYLEDNFPTQFDTDLLIPKLQLNNIRQKLNIEEVENKLRTRGASEALIKVVTSPLVSVFKQVSFNRANYVRLLLVEIDRRCNERNQSNESRLINDQLRDLSYAININSESTVDHFIAAIHLVVSTISTTEGKIEYLSLELKQINQIQVRSGIAYDPNRPDLTTCITTFLMEELTYLERISLNKKRAEISEAFSDFKIKFDISVAQIALLTKLLVETNVISNPNLSQLLQFLGHYSESKKAEKISYASLRTKYYNIEAGTLQSVKQVLQNAMKHLEKV
ncbi:hypothetical protein [Pseudochryseolinea flava]|uniref:Uncharacterized protein n=1 Tax=Pseudochryseolinea flava TaxID=2059302 RepID=A0A364Y5Q8_9BACT|nr:hypothetical protein [Pseudochryseolinea flava]RAW01565.1 hypothetical protein DQQ10_07860 [Pseudochryseolinea flava]